MVSLSKSDALYLRMRDDVLSLALVPDAPLRLPALSERYAIGLTPLRECLNRLSTENYVVAEHNKGFRVAPLTAADLLDLERSRAVIEGSLFVDAIGQGDDVWEAGVVGTFHQLSQTPIPQIADQAGLALWTKRHGAFHMALIGAAPSVWMRQFHDRLGHQLGRYHLYILNGLRELSLTHPAVADAADAAFASPMQLAAHQALYDVALSRDAAKATAVFSEHARISIDAFARLKALIPAQTPVAAVLGLDAEICV